MAFSVGRHHGALRRAISGYKYRGQRGWVPVLSGMLSSFVLEHPAWFEEYDLITAVPAFRGPGARRDWDPVGDLLEGLALRLGPLWPVRSGVVVKSEETPAMTGLGWVGRQEIARGPLRRSLTVPVRSQVAGGRILVVDDVLTDGATLREVALALIRSGADEVSGLVLARPGWSRSPRAFEPPAASRRPAGSAAR